MTGGARSFIVKLRTKSFTRICQRLWQLAVLWVGVLGPVAGARADPLGLVDYAALMEARADQTFCTGAALCTVILPGGRAVQQDAEGGWLAAGQDQTAGNFALGYALTLAIQDRCGEGLEGVEPAVFEAAVTEMQAVYQLSLEAEGFGQTAPPAGAIVAAFQDLRASLAGYVGDDPDLSRCSVPGALAELLVEMAQESYWQPELARLRAEPMLPTATFTID